MDLAGNADTARFRDSLQPRSDVDAIAEDSIIIVDNVSEVDADTKLHTPLGLDCGIAFDHLPLNGDCAFDCVQHTGELGQHAVSSGINDTSAQLAYHRQHNRLMALKVAHRARFVRAHQGAIAGDICGQDGCKPARLTHDRPSVLHVGLLSNREIYRLRPKRCHARHRAVGLKRALEGALQSVIQRRTCRLNVISANAQKVRMISGLPRQADMIVQD